LCAQGQRSLTSQKKINIKKGDMGRGDFSVKSDRVATVEALKEKEKKTYP